MPLPSGRPAAAALDKDSGAAVTYGDYFTAACDYLSRDRMAALVQAAGLATGQPVTLNPAAPVRIHLVKHGAFYHPALVTLPVGRSALPLALNIAISRQGRTQLPLEVESLRRLHRYIPENRIPQVYHCGNGCAPNHPPFPMFIAQWFTGFHEVHPSRAPDPARRRWSVWDSEQGPWHFDMRQTADFFRQAAHILTGCYDPHTLSAILNWHHAAGDFVVQRNPSGLHVRLITVRRYAPLFHRSADEALDLQLLLDALAVFLMRMSLWMRLDRLDGVGEMVWAPDRTLLPIWKGFVTGLGGLSAHNAFPEAFVEGAMRYLAGHTAEDWLRVGLDIVARYPADLAESVLMKRHLDRHAAGLASVIRPKG